MKKKSLNKPNNPEQDKLIELSRSQQSPGEALPEDFRITTAAEAANMRLPRHGQHGDDAREHARLMSEVGQNPQSVSDKSLVGLRKEPEDAEAPHSANMRLKRVPELQKQKRPVHLDQNDRGKSPRGKK